MPEVQTVNLKSDKPSVETARKRLNDAIEDARRRGVRVLKVIHGYGSSGVGGAIKHAVLASLRKRRKEGKVAGFVAGDKWDVAHEVSTKFVDAAPDLARDRDLVSNNEGITIVLLQVKS
jgi:hypothetical protein